MGRRSVPAAALATALLVSVAVPVAGNLPAAAAATESPHTVGIVDTTQGRWYLRDVAGGTTAIVYGNPGDAPFVGDWNCDGVDTPGLYRQSDGFVYLRNSNTSGVADVEFFFGNPGDVPLPGDFDGDGCDTVSIYRPAESRFYVINRLGAGTAGLGAADSVFTFGNPGDVPFVGDLDGDGIDEVGLHRPSTALVFYRTDLGAGPAHATFTFGDPGDKVVAGDWTGDGMDTIGAYRPGLRAFLLRHANAGGAANAQIDYGSSFMVPIAGAFGALPGGDEPPPVRAGALQPGDRGPEVAELQHALASKKFYRGPIDGSYGPRTEQAVMAFHKANRLPRTWDWKMSDWDALAAYAGPDNVPSRPGEPNRVEIDIGRQVLYLYENGAVAAIVPVSSGNGELFTGSTGRLVRAATPRGNFKLQRHINGLRISYLGVLWRPWYFTGGYAIHGSPNVPAWPASHGCVRLPNWEIDWMENRLRIGQPLHVWG